VVDALKHILASAVRSPRIEWLLRPHRARRVIARGRWYVRGQDRLVCLDLGGRPAPAQRR
jgi:hypothetical protein